MWLLSLWYTPQMASNFVKSTCMETNATEFVLHDLSKWTRDFAKSFVRFLSFSTSPYTSSLQQSEGWHRPVCLLPAQTERNRWPEIHAQGCFSKAVLNGNCNHKIVYWSPQIFGFTPGITICEFPRKHSLLNPFNTDFLAPFWNTILSVESCFHE